MAMVRRTRRHQKYREQVMRAHGGICHICGQGAADAIDHLVPVAWGGSDDPSNLAPAHTSCNSARGAPAPPQWTYERPSMWLPGYGPRSSSGASRTGRSGCSAFGVGALAGVVIGGLVTLLGIPLPISLIVVFAVAGAVIALMLRQPSTSVVRQRPVAHDAAGKVLLDARGVISNGGRACDLTPPGDVLERLDVEITGDNIDTLINLLQLGPGAEGFRDGLLGQEGEELIVYAMVRLTADVAATGDDDTSAAPIGRILADRWRQYPGLGGGRVSVQVGLGVDGAGATRCWVSFRRSVARC
ncbi:MAG: hypothetical protein CK552_05480 [Actinobacteria bacterium]|nr:MAG: hypothetical protein CK552_05480 [Actinomycetota bacterium]